MPVSSVSRISDAVIGSLAIQKTVNAVVNKVIQKRKLMNKNKLNF